MLETGSEKAYLVIAKGDNLDGSQNTRHFLAAGKDEGEAIRMVQEHIWPGMHVMGRGQEGGGSPHFNQFTVKTVWDCEPIPGKRLWIL